MPPSCASLPATACPKQPSMPLNAGRDAGKDVEAAGWPNSRSNTTSCKHATVMTNQHHILDIQSWTVLTHIK